MAASTSKGERKATALLPSILAQEGSTSLLTTWKMVEQCFSIKKKGKGKAKEPEPSTTMDEQLTHLLQCLHEARVQEDIGADVLKNLVMLLALFQDLNELDVIWSQRDEAQLDLFRF
ncbi:hypothetical protein C0989_010873 [Termitomyces sp. Mn162]|nr:hypothetical protein C0989_010873 [Termitomyces sp. Mn162]